MNINIINVVCGMNHIPLGNRCDMDFKVHQPRLFRMSDRASENGRV